jgi:superfamily II RNA helicase
MIMFPFPLSDFQTESIQAILDGHHSLVTAHTGSGKSVPAEFAIQHFTALGKKVIYTSPIKALSNQKFYEFTQKYPHISFGIMTGDIKLNPEADVVIMTTELLMNLLVSDSPMDNVACVVFDEVHYINDAERGRVWEQCILMLPSHIQMIMLSATIDAPEKFAEWCERKDAKRVIISSTAKRIVPLTHYGYLVTNEGTLKSIKDKALLKMLQESANKLIPLKTEHGVFVDAGYKEIAQAKEFLKHQKRQHVMNSLALHLRDRDMLPAIAFVFSRKHAELLATEITVPLLEFDSKVAYTVRRECEQIVRKLPNHAEYTSLPEYNQLVSLLEKGIGVHHSGMVPVLREIVELMISKKYIKLLFATESFAVGLNCPIRTAIFTSLTKFDGSTQRFLLPHEYNQAASRCGRRGIDTVGHVIHCNNLFDMPSTNEYKEILCGKPQTLVSKFRISFPLVLSQLKGDKANSMEQLADFVNRSMLKNELDKSIRVEQAHRDKLIFTNELVLNTPLEVCKRYNHLKDLIPTVANKKRKDADRELRGILDEHRTCAIDAEQVRKDNKRLCDLEEVESYIRHLETYITKNVEVICGILKQRGFANADYSLTARGQTASGIAEIHPLVAADCLASWGALSAKQLVGLLSCFTNVKVEQDLRINVPTTEDKTVKIHIEELVASFRVYEDLEQTNRTDPAFDYSNPLIFDMVDVLMNWCDVEDEVQCKLFIQRSVLCSIGDFTKAILKISAIVRELTMACEPRGMVDFCHTLSQVDGLILKYVATAQSLYV